MPYDAEKFVKVGALKVMAERTKGEMENSNVIEAVKVNNVALAISDKAVNISIAEGATDGTLSVNGTDIAFHGAADLFSKVATLIGSDASKSVRTIANEELAAQLIPETAKESLDTLTEIAAWIQNHPDDAAAMNSAITALQAVLAGIGGAEDEYATVADYVAGKLAEVSTNATKVEGSTVNGNIVIDGVETNVYTEPEDVLHGSAATDEEVAEMLNEVFGTAVTTPDATE